MLVLVRILVLSILVLFLDYLENLGTSPVAICCFVAAGTYAGFLLAKSKIRALGLLLLALTAALSCYIAYRFSSLSLSVFFSDALKLHSLQLHASILILAFLISAVSTFCICRSRHALTLEVFAFATGFVYFFAGHRNFNFQSPQILGDLAWNLAISPLTLLSGLSVFLFALVLLYLRLSHQFYQNLALKKQIYPQQKTSFSDYWLRSSAPFATILATLFVISNLVFSHYKIQAIQKTSMGVGQGKSENQSPLSFNSALGASNQPSALVRLEGDYSENPYIPTLYFRESALSLYSGVEMVAASNAYDQDIPSVAPESHFKASRVELYDYRVPLQQSVFPLTDHKLVFGVDFPTIINPLKNPDPKRFKAAYKVHSMAPAFKLDSIKNLAVGDPAWDFATQQHYLKTNPDKRYSELAIQLTSDLNTPIEKALALTDYLSAKSIYTLSPGHDLPANGDQTAPYLFGDMRGYCVHFAHALTYLFRSIGIPARVATGYQTDLSQSRDGHILLRMSDRHAWSEVFVSNMGWIPFDPKPQQVESHAETPVDMNLLEELMDLVGPSEEILPKDLSENDPALEKESNFDKYADIKIIYFSFLGILLILVLTKIYLWNSWRLPLSETKKSKHLYRSLLARIYDLGLSREYGQTWQEFRQKLQHNLKIDPLSMTDDFLNSIYSAQATKAISQEKFEAALKQLNSLAISKRLKALINVESLKCFFSQRAW